MGSCLVSLMVATAYDDDLSIIVNVKRQFDELRKLH